MLPRPVFALALLASPIALFACGAKTLGAAPSNAADGGSGGAAGDSSAASVACTLGPLPSETGPGAPSGAPGESSSGPCSLLGTWDFMNPQQGADAPNQASILFRADGDWFGGDYEEDVCATEFMYGLFSFDGVTLSIPNSSAMGPTCGAGSPATWSVVFNADCSSAALQVHLDDCTGGRLYLEDATVLMRRK